MDKKYLKNMGGKKENGQSRWEEHPNQEKKGYTCEKL